MDQHTNDTISTKETVTDSMNTIQLQATGKGQGIAGYNVPVPSQIHEQTNALIRIAHQKPNDSEAQRRARAAISLYMHNFGHSRSTEQIMGGRKADYLDEQSRFPMEIYGLIVSHLVVESRRSYRSKNVEIHKTLFSLSRTSRFFQELVEPYLYKYPQIEKLQSYKDLYLFRFSLAVEPRRESLVRFLWFNWEGHAPTRRLHIDIAQACPNLHMLHLWISDVSPTDESKRQVFEDLADLSAACANVSSFRLKIPSYMSDTRLLDDPRFAKFAQQVTNFELLDWGKQEWFGMAMLPHLSPNLTSLSLDSKFSEYGDFLPELCKRCPVLENLQLDCKFINAQGLVDACIAWGPTLKSLFLDYTDGNAGLVSQFFSHMQVLEGLVLEDSVAVHINDIIAIAQSQTGLRKFVLRSEIIEPNDHYGEKASPQLNGHLADLVTAHASTLQTIWVGGDFQLDRKVFESLKQAKHLKCIRLAWEEGLKQKDIDDLFAACPNLAGGFRYKIGDEGLHTLTIGDINKVLYYSVTPPNTVEWVVRR
ncbi:hypothetical protein F53441_9458 [Fusarium austroafricanum]|uniref:F-box domain-containing protein n=1 Tax=Fusarium austroafricanum TaxID=2364996 RepID=A0A8H4P3F5_9HYPO|nr:hypothetical protein F53441_9458 [Fusarium austroafricanum]